MPARGPACPVAQARFTLFCDLHGPVSSIVKPSRRRAAAAPVVTRVRLHSSRYMYKLMQFADATLKFEGWLLLDSEIEMIYLQCVKSSRD